MTVLFTGISGVRHDKVRGNFEEYIKENTNHREKDIISIDIGGAIKKEVNGNWQGFLDTDNSKERRSICREAVQKVVRYINEEPHEIALLSAHLCFLRRSHFFSPIDWGLLRKIGPDHVITLIDDIYTIQERIKTDEKETPTASYMRLRELINWRDTETLVTDRFVEHLNSYIGEGADKVDNYLVAVKHPIGMLFRLLFNNEQPVVYCGSSLSEPRKVDGGIDMVNRYRKNIHESFIAFDPATIDEAVLGWKFFEKQEGSIETKEKYRNKDKVELDHNDRWPLSFDGYRPLCSDEDCYPLDLKLSEVEDVAIPSGNQKRSDIKHQIRIRDFRLIDQSEIMLGYRPYFNGSKSTGLNAELNYVNNDARMNSFVVHKEEDSSGNMHPFDPVVNVVRDTEELIQEVEKSYYKEVSVI